MFFRFRRKNQHFKEKTKLKEVVVKKRNFMAILQKKK